MAPDDKDRLGNKLKDKERATEDRFIAEREKETLRKLREKLRAGGGSPPHAVCPRCGAALTLVKHYGVEVDECPSGHGMWLDRGEMEVIALRERESWLGKLFYVPKPKA